MEAGWQNNVKQVIRIALVGLEPSAQLAVKGYLRILLRVDFDIEWVSAKKPNVNLYIISSKFSNADSVKELLTEQPAPFLFVERSERLSNTIDNNTLYLRLDDIKILQRWLHEHVPMIDADGNFVNETPEELDAEVPAVISDMVNHQQTAQATQALAAQNHSQMNASMHSAFQTDGQVSEDTLALIQMANLRDGGLVEVMHGDAVIAVVDTKKRLVWPKGNTFYPEFALNWHTRPSHQSAGDDQYALNLHQWLWQTALYDNSCVSDLLPRHAKVSLRTWPKPEHDSYKSDYLKILALLELKAASVDDVVSMFGIHEKTVHTMMAALYLAGFLDMTGLPSVDILARQQMQYAGVSASADAVAGQRMDDGLLVNAAQPRENQEQIAQRKQVVKESGGFGGLLSRIRSSLGF